MTVLRNVAIIHQPITERAHSLFITLTPDSDRFRPTRSDSVHCRCRHSTVHKHVIFVRVSECIFLCACQNTTFICLFTIELSVSEKVPKCDMASLFSFTAWADREKLHGPALTSRFQQSLEDLGVATLNEQHPELAHVGHFNPFLLTYLLTYLQVFYFGRYVAIVCAIFREIRLSYMQVVGPGTSANLSPDKLIGNRDKCSILGLRYLDISGSVNKITIAAHLAAVSDQ